MRHGHAHVRWNHLAFYGLLLGGVLLVGGLAVWSFVARQALAIQPEPLPRITIVAPTADSKHAAAWIKLLTRADMNATLVPVEQLDALEGVIFLCDIPELSPALAQRLAQFAKNGGSVAFTGAVPATPIGNLRLESEAGKADRYMRLSEAISPVLARLRPGHEVLSHRVDVAFLVESPRMVVDARWRDSARAAIMHMELDGSRHLWFGLRPDALIGEDPQLHLLLRTAFRWIAGQPVSDGAIGSPQVAKTLAPEARLEARQKRFAFSVDRQKDDPEIFTIRMTNRGQGSISNPTVKIWLPPDVKRVAIAGDILMRRNASLTGQPEDGSCLVSLPRLGSNRDRVIKLRVASEEGR